MLSPAAFGPGQGDPAAARKLEDFFFFGNESLVRRSAPNRVTFSGVGEAAAERNRNTGGRTSNNSGSSCKNFVGICGRADVVEPQVIDDEVLKFSVQELHNEDGGSGDVNFAEIKDFRQVKSLALSYKNIMFIANLEAFTGKERVAAAETEKAVLS